MRYVFIAGALTFFFALPLLTFAWVPGQPLVPECSPYCSACELLQLVSNLLAFAVYFSTFIAVVMFAYAGFLYVTAASSTENLKKAHGIFTKVFIGFVFILTAWLVIDITLSVFTGKGFGPWSGYLCAESPAQELIRDNNPVIDFVPGENNFEPGQLTHDQALSILNGCGITVTTTRGPQGVEDRCTGRGCTSLHGMRSNTIEQACFLKRACGDSCEVFVTGGTERGVHNCSGPINHCTGFKIDIDDTDAVTSFILGNVGNDEFKRISNRRDGSAQFEDRCGNIYAREGTHWDILVREQCPLN